MSVIDEKYAELGGINGPLGAPVGDESQSAEGLYRPYQNGSIYWTERTGAHEVHGAIRGRWAVLGLERGFLGYPLSDELSVDDDKGYFNIFEHGHIYWTGETGAHEVGGPILDLWISLGGVKSSLGYPVSDEQVPYPNGTVKHFQGGAIYHDPVRGAYAVYPLPEAGDYDEADCGHWEELTAQSGVVGIHAALLHTGKVLFFAYGKPENLNTQKDFPGSAVFDPDNETIQRQELAHKEISLFCAGHAFLPDGTLLVCGSERVANGARAIHLFIPDDTTGGSWRRLTDLDQARWYPTCAPLPSGQMFIIGGHIWDENQNVPNQTYEIYDVEEGLHPAQPAPVFSSDNEASALYPFVQVLPSGQLFIHVGTRTHFLNLSTGEFNSAVLETTDRPEKTSRTYPVQGTCVLLPLLPDSDPPYRARVMLIGGGGEPETTAQTPATDTCELLDLHEPSPSWKLAAPMAHRRVIPDAVILPDGKVFVTNGSSTGKAKAGANPVLESELYDSETNTWKTLCSMKIPRLYHSIALLLPDGRVITTGSDSLWYPADFPGEQLNIEIYSPPYLFHGERPIIQEVPPTIRYDQEFKIKLTKPRKIAKAALLRPGSVTHSFNSTQRYIGLSMPRSLFGFKLLAPPDSSVAPPGHYMLFVLNDEGVPSVGRWVQLK